MKNKPYPLLLSALLFLVLYTCTQAKPNFLFISIDDLRVELGCYGDDHIISPNFDKLAASSMVFERAFC